MRSIGIGRVIAIALGTVALVLGACTQDQPEETEDPASGNRVLLDAAQQPLDRARAVEDIAAGRKGDLDQQMEAAE